VIGMSKTPAEAQKKSNYFCKGKEETFELELQ
jgi:hypothetical protein